MLDGPSGGGYRSPMRRARAAEVAVVDLAVCDRCGLCLPLCPPAAIHLALSDLLVDRQTCTRSEEHTSELQSRFDLVCRLLLEKKHKGTLYCRKRWRANV